MKKKIISTLLIGTMILAGCTANTNNDVENVKEYPSKETTIETEESETEVDENGDLDISNDYTDENGEAKDGQRFSPNVYINLSKLSPEEIVLNIFKLSGIDTGMSKQDIADMFILSDNESMVDKRDQLVWAFDSTSKNAISKISLNAYDKSNDEVTKFTDKSFVEVSFTLDDKDIANATFDEFIRTYVAYGYEVKDVPESQDTFRTYCFYHENVSFTITMSKPVDGVFVINVQIPMPLSIEHVDISDITTVINEEGTPTSLEPIMTTVGDIIKET